MDDKPLRWTEVHREEREIIGVGMSSVRALCLSGGGVRSASFCLGVLEAFRESGALERFHYLSTVSGGGYIGSWLSALRQRPTDQDESLPDAEARRLPHATSWLRQYSNYLSPRPGLLSLDTWTLVTTYLRNLLLNWLGLMPLSLLVILVPLISMVSARVVPTSQWQLRVLLGAGLLSSVVALHTAFASLPYSWRELGATPPSVRRLLWGFTVPLALACPLLATAWAWWRNTAPTSSQVVFVAELGAGVAFLAWVLARGRLLLKRRRVLTELVIAILIGALGGGVVAWIGSLPALSPPADHAMLYSLLATPVLLGTYLLLGAFFLAVASSLASRLRDRKADYARPGDKHAELGEEDLEWGARSGAWILILVAVWLIWAGLVLYGPHLLDRAITTWVPVVGGVSGLITVGLGRVAPRRSKEDDQQSPGWFASVLHLLPGLAAPIFAAVLLVLGSAGVRRLLPRLLPGVGLETAGDLPAAVEAGLLALVALGLILAAVAVDYLVDLNAFSLHGTYRSRLTRAYLGASVDDRGTKQNPFTGTCDEDDLPLYRLRRRAPFHVINMALNLVGGRALAFQERKACSFTMTPLHAGSGPAGDADVAGQGLGYRRMDGPQPFGGPDGVSLGTALAISGAAANPNMGYHSSAMVTLFLALFNARLGWWLGNPGERGEKTYYRSAPKHGLLVLLQEAFGLTDDRRSFVHLSDGGHFENLGLYEMIRRRADVIVVVDASCDPQGRFSDLGNALRKARVDFGVEINFDKVPTDPQPSRIDAAPAPAVISGGTVRYPQTDTDPAKLGTIFYLKPGLGANDEPLDVLAYARDHPAFPHETTADQWFGESQFESYRVLGKHLGWKLTRLPLWGRTI